MSIAMPAAAVARHATLLIALAVPSAPLQAAIYTVGSDAACTHATINGAMLAAILNPGHDVIRVTSNLAVGAQAIVIDNQSVTLAGGFETCASTSPAPNARTTLSGAGLIGSPAPVIRISNPTSDATLVELRALRVTGGSDGGIAVSGNVLVDVQDVLINANEAVTGGGIRIDGSAGATVILDERSPVFSNQASATGGGVHCNGAALFGTRGRIWRNTAGTHGGGIFATGGCTITAFPGNLDAPNIPGVVENRAGIDGGGIDASGGAIINLLGTTSRSMVLDDNLAETGSGGAIRAMGASTRVNLTDTHVTRNHAVRRGGGIAASSGAQVLVERSDGCDRGLLCSEFVSNAASGTVDVTDNFGGSLAVWSGALVQVESARLRASNARHAGAVAWVDGSNSLFEAEGVVVTNALGPQARIEAHNGGTAQFAHSTLHNTLAPGQTLLRASAGGTVRLYSSLVGEDSGTLFNLTGSGHGDADCVIAHEISSMPVSATRIGPPTAPSVLFAGPGDPHLRHDSPAIDFCDIGVVAPSTLDIDGEPRGVDRPERPNVHGPYDIGADEYHGPVLDDALFKDGFEAGS